MTLEERDPAQKPAGRPARLPAVVQVETARRVLAGKLTAAEAAKELGMGERTVSGWVTRLRRHLISEGSKGAAADPVPVKGDSGATTRPSGRPIGQFGKGRPRPVQTSKPPAVTPADHVERKLEEEADPWKL